MSVPVLALLALLARAVTTVLTHPTPWLVLLGWFVLSRFDLSVATRQFQQSITELWWLVALILLTSICNTAIRAYVRGTRRGDQ